MLLLDASVDMNTRGAAHGGGASQSRIANALPHQHLQQQHPTGHSHHRHPRMQADIIKMMYGYGDDEQPLQDTVELMESLVHDYIHEMCTQAHEVAQLSKREVAVGDFIYLIRKDDRRYKRMKALLAADEDLKEARDPKIKKLAGEA